MSSDHLSRINLAGIAVSGSIVLGWQLLVSTRILDFTYLPPPTEVFSSMVTLLTSGSTYADVFHTLSVTVVSSALAIVIGISLGTAVGLITPLSVWTLGTIDVLRTLPMIGLMPVALLLIGATVTSEIILATIGATWPLLVNTMGGVQQVKPRLLEVARMFRLSRRSTTLKVIIPSALPQVLVGARLAIVTAFVIAIVAEMLVSAQGLGWQMMLAQSALDPGRVWAYAMIAGILGYLLNFALVEGLNRIMPQLRQSADQAVGA